MSHRKFPPEIFITGTDTEIGKTVVSAILVAGLRCGYWKPIRTGLPYTDTDWIRDHTELSKNHFFPESYLFASHISPHLAAREEKSIIEMAKIKMPDYSPLEHLIIEGAGGLLVPINDKEMIIDVIAHLKIPALVVARSGLGTINHTLLTLEKLRQREIPIVGVVMNGPKNNDNKKSIEHYGKVRVLAQIESMATINAQSLRAAYSEHFAEEWSNG